MKKIFSAFTAALLCVISAMTAYAAAFSDTTGHWAEESIDKASEIGIINGDGDGTFRPDDPITRAEVIKIASTGVSAIFQPIDMNNTEGMSNWAAPYYNYAITNYLKPDNNHLIPADNGTAVYPGELTDENADYPIQRWELAYIAWQVADDFLTPQYKLELSYNDREEIEGFLPEPICDSIAYTSALKLFTGDENGNFDPKSNTTRAEVATLLSRVMGMFDISDAADGNTTNNNINNEKENQEMAEHSFATVTMENGGTFKIELMPEYAPETVANFISLAESGFYNGVTFHRIVEGFMAQGGDPEGNGTGGADKTIKGEFSANGFTQNTLSHTRGVISMARSGHPDSASSQFFICYDDASFLDGQYAAFGKVVEGMEVIDGFLKVERTTNSMGEKAVPVTPIVIKSITVSK